MKGKSGHGQICPFMCVVGEAACLRECIVLAHPWDTFYRKDSMGPLVTWDREETQAVVALLG